MIRLLHIENIAVIERADVEFSPGLNVLTGETGAGKSIVIDALSAVTGGRASRELIRAGADYAAVTAEFSDEGAAAWLDENGIEPDEGGALLLSRRITQDGKNVCRVNGCPVTVAQLRELGGALIDIHGQNDGRKLLDEGSHLKYLDAFAGLLTELGEYRAAYTELRARRDEAERLAQDEGERERRLDNLKFQIEEISAADVREDELASISARRDMLQNASKLTDAVETAFEALYGGDTSDGAAAMLAAAQSELERASRYSESLAELAGRLSGLRYGAEDIADELRDIREELDYSPDELDALESRIHLINRLTRKYGEDLQAYLEKITDELNDIEDSSGRIKRLEAEIALAARDAISRAEALSKKRRSAAKILDKRIREELSHLSMTGAEFVVSFEDVTGEYGINSWGRDSVCFLMSANAGQPPGKISRIASGGELSRIMLALKNVLTEYDETGTMVFDEVDAGVSGVAAQRVGEKLSDLARSRQVLCVTHLPQLAAMADAQFAIQKEARGGKTYTHVIRLDLEGRKRELARLTGGENITDITLQSSAEQLAAAEEYKRSH